MTVMLYKHSTARLVIACSFALILTACSHNDPPTPAPYSPNTPRPLVLSTAAEQQIKAIQNSPNLSDQQKQQAIAQAMTRVTPAPR